LAPREAVVILRDVTERKNEAEPGADAVPQVTQSKFTGGGEDIARVPIDAPVKQLVDRKA